MVRLVVWNVAKAADGKVEALLTLNPDLAILPECSETLPTLKARRPDATVAWCGADPSCGLAVVGFGGLHARRVGPRTPELVWVMPVRITGTAQFDLLAVWADNDHGRLVAAEGPDPLGPVRRALLSHPAILTGDRAVVAGDFNNNNRYDKPAAPLNHSNAVADLRAVGLESVYHRKRGVGQGEETEATFYSGRRPDKPGHLDYCFVPESWRVRCVAVGSWAEWCQPKTGFSDHAPLSADLEWGAGPEVVDSTVGKGRRSSFGPERK